MVGILKLTYSCPMKIFFILANMKDPDEWCILWHFILVFTVCQNTWPRGYKTFFMLNSTEHEI